MDVPLPDKNAIITAQNLSFGYQEHDLILKDVSFDVAAGEFIGIIGPNGGGKTTLLKLLLGFLTPQSGTILIDGKAPAEQPNNIAYVPQSLRFDKQFPIAVLDVVLGGRLSRLPWWGRFSKQDREIAMASLREVGMEDQYLKPFGSLSGGQAQRVLLARALASEPKVLLLDEPTASVDAAAEAEIHELLSSLTKTITIMMVTHDLRAAIQLVDRVIIVQGRVASMQPKEVCEHFALGLYHFPLIETVPSHIAGMVEKSPFAKTRFPQNLSSRGSP